MPSSFPKHRCTWYNFVFLLCTYFIWLTVKVFINSWKSLKAFASAELWKIQYCGSYFFSRLLLKQPTSQETHIGVLFLMQLLVLIKTDYWTAFTLELLKNDLYSSELCKITVHDHQTWHFRTIVKQETIWKSQSVHSQSLPI